MKKEVVRLGTRRSLLAWAQSSWVAREVMASNPELHVELVGIETQGDRITDIPLQKVEGKDFFVRELDEALLAGQVDLTVHSLKDLSLERPPGITQAAVPPRENPRDIVVFGPKALDRILGGNNVRIGTSSPRRLENAAPFLSQALPWSGQVGVRAPAKVEMVEIRGNVNTRLSRVLESLESPRYLDGVILAMAGLNRLMLDEKGCELLRSLRGDLRFMLLPLSHCPAAPAQGALAVECRSTDRKLLTALSRLHDEGTATQVRREREILALWGGGCHQKLGATLISHPELREVFYIRGRKPDGTLTEEVRWTPVKDLNADAGIRPWDGSRAREGSFSTEALSDVGLSSLKNVSAVFVSHYRALSGLSSLPKDSRIWTAGVPTWFELAKNGYWVEGCAESLGVDQLIPTLEAPLLDLPPREEWITLTHEQAADGSELGKGIATYRVKPVSKKHLEEAEKALAQATHVYWSSGSQFDALGAKVSPEAHQSCGPGKTARHLRSKGVQIEVFPSAREWRKWLGVHE